MKQLILMRHATAGEAETDAARPLRPSGHVEARRVGVALSAQRGDFTPDAVLCSSALRARQTYQGLREGFPALTEADFQDRLYLISAGALLGVLQDLPEACACALVIAHEPGLSDAVSLLAADASPDVQARAVRGMAPGAIAMLRFATARWAELAPASGELAEFLRPADLTAATID